MISLLGCVFAVDVEHLCNKEAVMEYIFVVTAVIIESFLTTNWHPIEKYDSFIFEKGDKWPIKRYSFGNMTV